ncbi:hypothetical protein HMPREF9136_1094 [Prevotella dentalis DSM 3688]|uniref:Uncharacterized protein n=1 Tax=Prevotella dentalis (strain ATCC 49559 / DSM 3688 / JCM 13448 / NCTC 12043 / ES 2772) TaxID=908937 RepID=F9D2D5_PREDD|nr:hypothetical protein HMPREF9136_1094 [Prevotella dentalis DSM 3688]
MRESSKLFGTTKQFDNKFARKVVFSCAADNKFTGKVGFSCAAHTPLWYREQCC